MSTDASVLSRESRSRALTAATTGTYDLVVIGGGVTGAGCALDAAARGLSVVLVEAGDLAVGTSSRSGKTFHGGLRYLEQLNFKLVAGALLERDLMINRLCPHLARPEKFLYPLTKHWERPYAGAGILLYDLMGLSSIVRAGGRGVPHHRHLTRRGALREAPALDPKMIVGAIQYYDARIDDARHTLAVARTAAAYGAQVLSRTRVVDFLRADGGRVTGVAVLDAPTGQRHEIRATAVINAAGVWSAQLQQLAGAETFGVRPAKGIHLLLPRAAIDADTGILARADDSVLVIRKWWDCWIVGTTDTPWDGPLDAPVATGEDVDYLLDNTNRYLSKKISRADVLGVYAGLRPLLAPAKGDKATTSALSRDHSVLPGPDGMITIVGGKYTTYRPMAADAVDAAARWLGRAVPPSATAELPLIGAAGWAAARNSGAALAARYGVDAAEVERMLGRYGDRTGEVLAPVADDPALGRPLPGAPGYLAAELLYAVTAEGATTLEDVLARRTHLEVETADGAASVAPAVAALIGPALGWSAAEQDEQLRAYLGDVAVERAALV